MINSVNYSQKLRDEDIDLKNKNIDFHSALNKTIRSVALGTIYTCAFIICLMGCNHKKSKQYKLLAKYHFFHSKKIKTWWMFHKYLINYSVNIENSKTLIRSMDEEKLNKYFARMQQMNDKHLILEKKMLRKEKGIKGVCLGASLSLIKNFQKFINQGMTHEQAFKKAADLQSDGIGENACLKHALQLVIKLNRLGTKELYKDRLQLISHLFKLNVTEVSDQWTKTTANPFIENLPTGCYEVGMIDHKKGHSIVFIKTWDKIYAYDSNFGAAILPVHKQTWIIQKLMNYYRYEYISFSSMERPLRVDPQGEIFA